MDGVAIDDLHLGETNWVEINGEVVKAVYQGFTWDQCPNGAAIFTTDDGQRHLVDVISRSPLVPGVRST